MSKNVYNLVWADDEIDDLLDNDTIVELKEKGFNIIGMAHDGEELERFLSSPERIDAVIVDANFNESDKKVDSERDTSGLEYARSLYRFKLNCKIPFFLFTNRSDELLKNIYQHNSKFLEDFPRYIRWFNKSGQGEYDDMLEKIKSAVDERNSPEFQVRNRYQNELNAASILDGVQDYIFKFLVHDYENTLDKIDEPFVSTRKAIEKIFAKCEDLKIIPPISSNTNGTAYYFLHGKYGEKGKNDKFIDKYTMSNELIMPKPLAYSLKYIVDITQDASHTKKGLMLNVDIYFENNKDILLLRSVVFILIDLIKWFAITALNHRDEDTNELTLWKKCN